MSKTPEELAVEFSKFDPATDIGTDLGSYRQGLFEGFLAGYKAAQDQFRSTTGGAGDKLTPTGWISAGYKAEQDQLADADKVMNSLNNSNGWISVKDRLPEDGQEVLVFEEGTISTNCYSYNRVLSFRWDLYPNGFNCNPSHWMPLPAPPKEEYQFTAEETPIFRPSKESK